MPTTQTIATLTVENQTFYDRTLLERLLPESHFYRDADKKVIPRGKGTSIEFRKFNSLPIPAASLTEGVTPAGNSLTTERDAEFPRLAAEKGQVEAVEAVPPELLCWVFVFS